ncbi:histidinol-phosphate aminotransferase [Mycoplana sp. BE70]|nr:histidinol-phosphate aminotransferase [Mycoplana sp. BE70]
MGKYNAGLTTGEVRERYAVTAIAKLGSNESPLGPSPKVAQALAPTSDLMRLYPDPAGRTLREAIGGRFGMAADRVILGNGSEDLLSVISRAVLRSGDRIVTPYPSFPLHEDYATVQGATVARVAVDERLNFDIPSMKRALREPCRMLIVANPMNPVGSWLDGDGLTEILASVPRGALVVIDEAYAEYARGSSCPDALALLKAFDLNWVVLRTFSKAYGLAGLRIGYGLTSSAGLTDLLDRVRTPFNANAFAQAAALAALADDDHLEAVVSLAVRERERVRAFLEGRHFVVAPSCGNFLFFDCGKPAHAFSEALLAHGVITKPWKQEGYEAFIRVSIGSEAENDQFINAIGELCSNT